MDNAIIVHVGNPKAYSTYLQTIFAKQEKQNKITYSGFRPNSDLTKWYQCNIESNLYNYGLRYQSKFHFRRSISLFRKFIDEKIDKAVTNKQVAVFSSENIIMKGLPNELDVEDKIQRLQEIMPYSKNLVCVFRNILQSIYSIYKEYVNHGYSGDWSFFLQELYLLRESNFLNALLPHVVHQQLKENTSDNVDFVYTNNRPTNEIFEALRVQMGKGRQVDVVNKGFQIVEAETIAKQNANNKIDIIMAGMSELHRVFWPEVVRGQMHDDYFWRSRRKIKANIKAGKKHNHLRAAKKPLNLKTISDFECAIYSSRLFYYLQEQCIECRQYFENKQIDNLCQSGDPAEVWKGIMEL